jgi:hypothetical protein
MAYMVVELDTSQPEIFSLKLAEAVLKRRPFCSKSTDVKR